MKIVDMCAVVVIATSLAAAILNFNSNPRAALYAATTGCWALIALMRG